MARFFPLEVSKVRRDTRDSVAVTLVPRMEDLETFDFIQGQFLTFRRSFEGEELRRSYSICAGRDEGCLRVGIKRVEGGCFSTWANEELQVGETLEAMPPMGAFYTAIEPEEDKYHLGFAGGSGITPVISIIKTVLAREPKSRFTLIYANRSANSIMFREEIEDLKNTYLDRFSVIHVLEIEARDIDLFSGRIDSGKCAALFKSWIDIQAVSVAYICGPEPMMLAIASTLREHGLDDSRIKLELFASPQHGRAPKQAVSKSAAGTRAVCKVSITLDGATREIEMAKGAETLLDAALGADLDAPHACRAGVCSTCRALVLDGEVEMQTNHALEDYEVRRGYVLACQCLAFSDTLVVTYDQ